MLFKSACADIEGYQGNEIEHKEIWDVMDRNVESYPHIRLLIGKDTHFRNSMF